MITTGFREDLEFIIEKIKRREHFAFSKYADGEYKILRNQKIRNVDNWVFNPDEDANLFNLLYNSFIYNHPEYYVGISCPCCQPTENINWMRETVTTKNVTWANLFVNSNYDFFVNNAFPEFNNWNGKVILFANEVGINKKLPFRVDEYVGVKLPAWKNGDLDRLINVGNELADRDSNQLFLFSAGPVGNILSFLLFSNNKNNTYLDIGSTTNRWIVGNNRGYLRNNNRKTCIW